MTNLGTSVPHPHILTVGTMAHSVVLVCADGVRYHMAGTYAQTPGDGAGTDWSVIDRACDALGMAIGLNNYYMYDERSDTPENHRTPRPYSTWDHHAVVAGDMIPTIIPVEAEAQPEAGVFEPAPKRHAELGGAGGSGL
jgi:hypothetical protein